MSLATLTSKGQITIPKDIRDKLELKPSDRVIFTIENDHAVLKPIRGNILDIGGSVKVSAKVKAADFKKIREKVRRSLAKNAVERGKK